MRIRSYDLPHKALRNALSQLMQLAGKTNFTDSAQVKRLKSIGNEVITLLHSHSNSENEIILKQLESRQKGSSVADLEDHEVLEEELNLLTKKLDSLSTQTDANRALDFFQAVSVFYSHYIAHMIQEETITENLIQAHFTDEELISHRNAIMQKIGFPELLLWLKYAVPALPDVEAMELLKGVRGMVPAEDFQAVMRELKLALPDQEYRQFAKAVC